MFVPPVTCGPEACGVGSAVASGDVLVLSLEIAAERIVWHDGHQTNAVRSTAEDASPALAISLLDLTPLLIPALRGERNPLEPGADAGIVRFGGRGRAALFELTWSEVREKASHAPLWMMAVSRPRRGVGRDSKRALVIASACVDLGSDIARAAAAGPLAPPQPYRRASVDLATPDGNLEAATLEYALRIACVSERPATVAASVAVGAATHAVAGWTHPQMSAAALATDEVPRLPLLSFTRMPTLLPPVVPAPLPLVAGTAGFVEHSGLAGVPCLAFDAEHAATSPAVSALGDQTCQVVVGDSVWFPPAIVLGGHHESVAEVVSGLPASESILPLSEFVAAAVPSATSCGAAEIKEILWQVPKDALDSSATEVEEVDEHACAGLVPGAATQQELPSTATAERSALPLVAELTRELLQLPQHASPS